MRLDFVACCEAPDRPVAPTYLFDILASAATNCSQTSARRKDQLATLGFDTGAFFAAPEAARQVDEEL
jgi:hypothetical protein